MGKSNEVYFKNRNISYRYGWGIYSYVDCLQNKLQESAGAGFQDAGFIRNKIIFFYF